MVHFIITFIKAVASQGSQLYNICLSQAYLQRPNKELIISNYWSAPNAIYPC